MAKAPSFQFYPGDYLKDPALSMCSPATRGIWMDLICAAHELARCGQITGTPDQLARACRCTAADFVAAVEELRSTGTADVRERAGIYTVTNRRMRREWQEREDARLRQQKRRGNSGNFSENQAEKRAAKSQPSQIVTESELLETAQIATFPAQAEKCHTSEAVDVTAYSSTSSSSSPSGEEQKHVESALPPSTGEPPPDSGEDWQGEPEDSPAGKRRRSPFADQVRELFAYWQETMSHPSAKLTATRRRAIESRLREGYTLAELKAAVDGCRSSAWHMGGNETGTVYDELELICRNGSKVEQFKGRLTGRGNGAIAHRYPNGAGSTDPNLLAAAEAKRRLFGHVVDAEPIDAEVIYDAV